MPGAAPITRANVDAVFSGHQCRCMVKSALVLLSLLPAPALAHPHVFVDASVETIFDGEGRLVALRIGWTYDELFSLMLVEDGQHDTDGNGAVSEAEMTALDGFDMDWGSDFLGDTYVAQGDSPVALIPGPQDWITGWKDGRLYSAHTRTFETPLEVGTAPVSIRIYDPGYYVAYTILPEPKIDGGTGCTAEIFVPDLDAAQSQLLDSLKEYAPGDDLEDVVFPNVGADFAEEVRLSCGG